ncbi:hypothetical protein Ais01nite_65210 [Asanoa ishikariensis]|uniref:Uncharacterized protein n=1 Tax=Asanoa ishikariensis TaxID=137265 RepID=A0A1H3NNA7_9ACTN|nr:hypothetical protein [Asanoa ishikariensis]GIF68486.1 hypothetical protein Ais01nite_65210 [Asanoa ishikariensis]SDY90437.1 hypothetical protein SAMN05421684_2203 [Asanoa ishikariensis]
MSAHENEHISIISAAFAGGVAVAAVGFAATVAVPTTVGRLLAVAAAVAVVSALVPDLRAWLAVTAVGAATFLLAVDGRNDGVPYLAFLGLAAVLGRGQRWMRHLGTRTRTSSPVDR